ncbi:hypothetical protein OIU77_000617, partial [Salix suchowensis]
MSKRHLIPSWNLSSGLLISHLASEKMTWMAGRKPEILLVKLACSEYGFSQVVNHGAPLGLMTRAIELSRTFFETLPNEEKLKCDEAGGLEVRRDGEWIPVIPTRGSLVVNVGDVFQ